MFITFEGHDFVGKSTQAKILYHKLVGHLGLCKTILTHEPGGTPFGMRIREILKSEPNISLKSQFHLVESQRAHHVETVILPAIAENKTVICDRFIDSSYVYQHAYMSEFEWQEYLDEYPVRPDLTFWLFTDDIKKTKERSTRTIDPNDHFDNESNEKLLKKHFLFLKLYKSFPRIIPINTDRSIEVVAEDIWMQYKWNSGSHNEGSIRP